MVSEIWYYGYIFKKYPLYWSLKCKLYAVWDLLYNNLEKEEGCGWGLKHNWTRINHY